MLAVGAIDIDKFVDPFYVNPFYPLRCSFSKYGQGLSLVAPGCGFIQVAGPSGDPADVIIFNGTSAASPHVAAIAAMIATLAPTLGVEQLRSLGLSGAIPAQGVTPFTPYDPLEYGRGRANAFASLIDLFHQSPVTLEYVPTSFEVAAPFA